MPRSAQSSLALLLLLLISCCHHWRPSSGRRAASNLGLEVSERSFCKADVARQQADQFHHRFWKNSTGFVPGWSACSPHWWLDTLAEFSPTGTKVLFDVGANKGYETAHLLQVFGPQLGITPRRIYDLLKGKYPNITCGACNNCMEQGKGLGPAKLRDPSYHLEVHSFDPSTIHFKRLQDTRNTMLNGGDTLTVGGASVTWHLHHGALADKPGTAKFPTDCDTTWCSLAHGKSGMEEVNVSTVDTVMAKEHINYIDVLKIDAEGYDAAVLAGAEGALREHRIAALVFEYSGAGLWAVGQPTLQSLIKKLAVFGYVCWFEGDKLTRLTGCWHPSYEFKQWSNVVCTVRGSSLARAVSQNSFV